MRRIPQRAAGYSRDWGLGIQALAPSPSPQLRQTQSLERERWIFVDEEKQIRLDAQRPAHDAKRKWIERRRIGPGEQNREPRDDGAEHPGEDEKEQHHEMRHGQDQTHGN